MLTKCYYIRSQKTKYFRHRNSISFNFKDSSASNIRLLNSESVSYVIVMKNEQKTFSVFVFRHLTYHNSIFSNLIELHCFFLSFFINVISRFPVKIILRWFSLSKTEEKISISIVYLISLYLKKPCWLFYLITCNQT